MVVQSDTQKVVMLTPIQEKGRIKCEIYFPEKLHECMTCGKFEIKCINIHKEKSYCIRTLRVRDTTIKISDTTIQKSYNINNCTKYCCKQSGKSKKLSENNQINQSPNHTLSPLITNNNEFFNDGGGELDDDDDDDIFTNIEYRPQSNRPRQKLRSRDCKFSDDFTDVLNFDLQGSNDSNDVIDTDVIYETDRIVQHYWYQTWPDHNLANTEEILALALDVLDLRNEIESLFVDINRTPASPPPPPSHNNLVNNKISTKHEYDNCQRNNLASNINKSEFQKHIDKFKESNFNTRCQKSVSDKKNFQQSVPIIVHCSAGIGRTGCFLAILNGIQQLKHNFNVDILAIVCALRLNRGGMVQTAEQYELIHKVLALYSEYVDK